MAILHPICGRAHLSRRHCHSSTICNSTLSGLHNNHPSPSNPQCILLLSFITLKAAVRCTALLFSNTQRWVLWETLDTRTWASTLTNLARVLTSTCSTRVLQGNSQTCLAGLPSKLPSKDGNRIDPKALGPNDDACDTITNENAEPRRPQYVCVVTG
jgi:hypothetical protein